MDAGSKPVRPHHLAETIANSVTHGVGFLASLVALPVLVVSSARDGDTLRVIGAAIFGVSLVMLYAASTVYHSFPHVQMRRTLRVIDHSAIFVLIAGSYTPFMLGALRGTLGYSMLIVIWTMAAAGVFMKAFHGFGRPALTAIPYVAMGWLCAVVVKPLTQQVGPAGFWWLLAGGLFYTTGVVF
jgi:hemolysin III